ncbi:MAG: cytochrome c peroxidase [Pseudomonadota bacterium]
MLSPHVHSACVDPDGDGWGWDGARSCRVAADVATREATCVDPDGDGWGWDGMRSCQVATHVATQEVTDSEVAGPEVTGNVTCVDPDGDGWGWDGQRSCQTNASISEPVSVSAAVPDSVSTTVVSPQGSGELEVPVSVCEVLPGRSNCGVAVSFNVAGGGPHCLFEKATATQTNATLVTCGNPTKTRITLAADQHKIIELRSGSLDYGQSALRDSKTVVGISVSARGDYQLIDSRRNEVLQNNQARSLATSWDSRLSFDVAGAGNNKNVSVVRVLRSGRLAGQSAGALQATDLFSGGHVLASDSMSSAEASKSSLRVKGKLGTNEIGIKVPFNIAVYPNNRYATNPFRSDANGRPDDFGQFETYRFYAVMGARQAGNVNSQFNLIPSNAARGKKFFLTRFEASVIVSNARTVNAAVHDVVVHSKAQPLRDNNGSLIYGYEASATLDGRMIVYSGNSNPGVRSGHGGEVLYVYNADQHNGQDWSQPANVANMYYQHGPGSASGETRVGEHLFSEHFPFALQPVRQYNAETPGAGGVVKGSYPWVSLRGSEIFFMARASFHGGNRSGATMVGFRTGGQLWHMDGDINNARGNPTDSYDHFASANGGQYKAIVNAYEARKFAGTNKSMGKNSWNNLFFRPLGQYPSSWNAVAEVANAPVPLNPYPESYGFWLTGNRYYEIPFPLYPQDLVAYYPMNEPLYHDQTLLRAWQKAGPGAPSAEHNRRYSTAHVTDKTADLSAHQHTGQFRNGAKYPFEYYDAKKLWANQRIIKDQSEGAIGNSVFFNRNAAVVSELKAQALQPVVQNQSFAVALWFNTSSLSEVTQLLHIDNLLTLTLQQGSVTAQIGNDGSRESFNANANVRTNHWHHIALSWSAGELQVYFDGSVVARFDNGGHLLLQSQQARVSMGPNGRGPQNLLLKLDEVSIYSTFLSAADVSTLAWRKRHTSANSDSFFVSSTMARDYPGAAAGVDVSFRPRAGALAIGERLFNTTALSRNNTVSCASCHQSGRAFTDGQRLATGINGRTGSLNTPAIANLLLSDSYFYHGGAASLEMQAIHTILHNGEMGVVDPAQIVNALPSDIRSELQSVYSKAPTVSDVARALAAFVNTIRVTGNSHLQQDNLTAQANRGKRLFNGKANCVGCHSGTNFTDNRFHHVGVVSGSEGRRAVTDRVSDHRAQKTPTLRNVALTAPYFHDGSEADLAAVVRHYNNQSHRESGRRTDSQLHPLELSESEISDIVEYLHALSGDVRSGR